MESDEMDWKTRPMHGAQRIHLRHLQPSVLVTPLDVHCMVRTLSGVPLHIGVMKRVETVDVGNHQVGASLDGPDDGDEAVEDGWTRSVESGEQHWGEF